jgi:hypothetical protein
MKLTIGIATRGRPALAAETARITQGNIADENTQIILLADADDIAPECAGIRVDVRKREDSIAAKWNRLLEIAPADVYLAMVDHSPVVSKGFDVEILKAASAFHDGIGCVYAPMANLSFPSYQAPTARMAEIMGCIYPTYFPYWFVDHWLEDLCKMTGRFSFADIKIDHRKRPGTQDFREPGLWASVYDAMYEEREEIADRLIEAMDESESHKALLRRNFPLVHQRSRIINNIVRNMPATDKTIDERYLRIHRRGIAIIESSYHQLKSA